MLIGSLAHCVTAQQQAAECHPTQVKNETFLTLLWQDHLLIQVICNLDPTKPVTFNIQWLLFLSRIKLKELPYTDITKHLMLILMNNKHRHKIKYGLSCNSKIYHVIMQNII